MRASKDSTYRVGMQRAPGPAALLESMVMWLLRNRALKELKY
jgi:hypothetical protein